MRPLIRTLPRLVTLTGIALLALPAVTVHADSTPKPAVLEIIGRTGRIRHLKFGDQAGAFLTCEPAKATNGQRLAQVGTMNTPTLSDQFVDLTVFFYAPVEATSYTLVGEPAHDTSDAIVRISIGITAGDGLKYSGTGGTVTVSPDYRTLTFDAQLTSKDRPRSPLRLIGSASCFQNSSVAVAG